MEAGLYSCLAGKVWLLKKEVTGTWEIGFSTRNVLHHSSYVEQTFQGCTVSWAGKEQQQPVLDDVLENPSASRAISAPRVASSENKQVGPYWSPRVPVLCVAARNGVCRSASHPFQVGTALGRSA